MIAVSPVSVAPAQQAARLGAVRVGRPRVEQHGDHASGSRGAGVGRYPRTLTRPVCPRTHQGVPGPGQRRAAPMSGTISGAPCWMASASWSVTCSWAERSASMPLR